MSGEERVFALVQLCVVLKSGQQSVALHLGGPVTCYHYTAGLRASLYVLNVREAETQINCALHVPWKNLQHRYCSPPAFNLEKKVMTWYLYQGHVLPDQCSGFL